MYPQSHFLLPFAVGELLVKYGYVNHWFAILAGLLGVAVDSDHYLYHLIRHRDLSVQHAWNAAVIHHELGERTFLHHLPGFILVNVGMFLMSYVAPIGAAAVALGFNTHILLDHVSLAFIPGFVKVREAGFVLRLSGTELLFDFACAAFIVLIWV